MSLMIPEALLLDYKAIKKNFKKKELLFYQGDRASHYYQLISGTVKMNNYNDEGKEFIQGLFSEGESFGEPPLFMDIVYPANAEVVSEAEVWVLKKSDFLQLLYDSPEIHFKMTAILAGRLYYKAMIASEISGYNPEHRILRIIDYFKNDIHQTLLTTTMAKKKYDRLSHSEPGTGKARVKEKFGFKVPLTRQQLADLTGLRVETVIRCIKALEKKKELLIKDRKVFR